MTECKVQLIEIISFFAELFLLALPTEWVLKDCRHSCFIRRGRRIHSQVHLILMIIGAFIMGFCFKTKKEH